METWLPGYWPLLPRKDQPRPWTSARYRVEDAEEWARQTAPLVQLLARHCGRPLESGLEAEVFAADGSCRVYWRANECRVLLGVFEPPLTPDRVGPLLLAALEERR